MASKTLNKQPRRKQEMIQAAAEVMRKKGVLTTRLQDVADHLGMAYTALYNYFPSRDHLAEEVLTWTIKGRLEMLDSIKAESALDQLLVFFRRVLMERRVVQVRVPLLFGLPEPHRAVVADARDVLLNRLIQLLDEGMAEGSIRPLDATTNANALLVLLERLTIAEESVFSNNVRALPLARVADQICGVLDTGILIDRDMPPQPSFRLGDPSELLSFNPELTPDLAKMDRIFAVATRHLNLEGPSASIPRIASEIGVSKTVIYQFVLDKQDLIYQCYQRGIEVVEMSQRIADDFGEDPLDAIVIHRNNLYRFHDCAVGPFAFLNAVGSLKPQHQRLISTRNRGLRDTSVGRLRRAQEQSLIVPDIDADIVQPIFGQMLYGLPGWYDDSQHTGIEDVCWQTGLIPFIGLRQR